MESNTEKAKVIKILIVGDANSGKSCLLYRFVQETFSDRYVSTIGVDFQITNGDKSNYRSGILPDRKGRRSVSAVKSVK